MKRKKKPGCISEILLSKLRFLTHVGCTSVMENINSKTFFAIVSPEGMSRNKSQGFLKKELIFLPINIP